MGRIVDADLRLLAEQWSPLVREMLDGIGMQRWPPLRQRRDLFNKPILISRYDVEGPVQRDGQIVWALSHTSRPSSFDERGILSEGERQFWLVTFQPGEPPHFRVEGVSVQPAIPTDTESLRTALARAHQDGPRIEVFFGNKGPLSHR